MATIYNIKIKTVSPFCNYDEKYITEMFSKFLKDYSDDKTGLSFESTEINVEKVKNNFGVWSIKVGERRPVITHFLCKCTTIF